MIGFIIALLIVVLVFYDTITTIRWIRRQHEQDKMHLMMVLAITIALLMSEYVVIHIQK